ncbi:predicted GPI-anchored protein 58 [Aquila chrysaetos chrysaetos]|uniref:predicted GPI-anchored protein 58 n=1 Tax=Aquila chrysaetos chrysaetos TaxID=223781 RepID=UPI00117723A1|nr:predicted GPI-anchored protein 58 [Aquila chrysaetos chrysaetos]
MERKKKKERKKEDKERESKKKKGARKRHRKDGQTDNDRRTKRKARRAALCRSPFAHPLSRTWSGLGWECWHHGSVPVAVPARGPAGSAGARRGSLPRCSSLVSPGRPDPARYRCAASRAPTAAPSRSPPAAETPERRQRAALPRPGPAARSRPAPPLALSGDLNRPVPSRPVPRQRGRCAAPRSAARPPAATATGPGTWGRAGSSSCPGRRWQGPRLRTAAALCSTVGRVWDSGWGRRQ